MLLSQGDKHLSGSVGTSVCAVSQIPDDLHHNITLPFRQIGRRI